MYIKYFTVDVSGEPFFGQASLDDLGQPTDYAGTMAAIEGLGAGAYIMDQQLAPCRWTQARKVTFGKLFRKRLCPLLCRF